MDFQNRAGGKTGSGGVASWSESNRDRRERLRQLALETIDLNKVKIIYSFFMCSLILITCGLPDTKLDQSENHQLHSTCRDVGKISEQDFKKISHNDAQCIIFYHEDRNVRCLLLRGWKFTN